VEYIVHDPGTAMDGAVLAALVTGVGLFVGASCLACWRTTGRILTARLAIVALTIVGAVLVGGADPIWPLTVIAAGLLAIVVIEGRNEAELPASSFVVD
jgi:hypothetical protein